jgi:hypothetical protein
VLVLVAIVGLLLGAAGCGSQQAQQVVVPTQTQEIDKVEQRETTESLK